MRGAAAAVSVAIALVFGSAALPATPSPNDGCCSYPSLPVSTRAIADVVPHGWQIEAQASGVLGKDKLPAVVLVLRDTDARYVVGSEAERVDTNPRMLLLEIARPDGEFTLAAQNHLLIPRLNTEELKTFDYELGTHQKNIDMPAVEIAAGSIVLHLNESIFVGPNAEIDRTFKFQLRDGKLILVGYDVYAVTQSLAVMQRSFNYLSRKVKISRGASCAGTMETVAHCRFTSLWKDLPSRPLLSLEEVGNGLEFEPDPNVF